MYSPPLGRFLSRDPLPQTGDPDILYDNNWFGDALTEMRDLYGYTSNNPANATDPSGLMGYGPGLAPKPPKCPPGCTADMKKDIIKKLSDVAKRTQVPGIIEHCDRWELQFEKNLFNTYGPDFPTSPCIKSFGPIRFTWMWAAGHAAYEVVWCDLTITFVDNGYYGGDDHIFDTTSIGTFLHAPYSPLVGWR